MQVDKKLLEYLEDLSQLTLAEEEKPRIISDLQEILGSMNKLAELDTENVPERSHPFDDVNAFREDVVTNSFDRALILENAPRKTDEVIIAPKTIE